MMKLLLLLVFLAVFAYAECGSARFGSLRFHNVTDLHRREAVHILDSRNPIMVPLTLINAAAAKGAVCLDGTLPGYHFDPGHGSGSNSWLIQLEGGGWCNTVRTCVYRKQTRRGSSIYMEKMIPFTGILSNYAENNPDFFNWNRVKIRYCDGASFTGDSSYQNPQLEFRGQKIWKAAMEELMSKGMLHAKQALLSGCSAGGLASILHCDNFHKLLAPGTNVKCLADGGLFLDAFDIAGQHTLRKMFNGVVTLQGVQSNLPGYCTSHLDPTSCFFPENVIAGVKTPLFILNAAYDSWQVQASLATTISDPQGSWTECKRNHTRCSAVQMEFLQNFRYEMMESLHGFSSSPYNGFFVNSCFAHCQSERQDTWFANDSPLLGNRRIATAVGDWYFDRARVNEFDCPYPCDSSCHNLVFP